MRFWTALPLLAPAVLWQAYRTRGQALRLPPVLDETAAGTAPGEGPLLRLLVAGESTAVGVGATQAEYAMAPQLAGALAKHHGREVRWQVIGENGIRAAALADKLSRHRELLQGDVALVLLGANDVSGLTGVRRWQKNLEAVISLLRQGCGTIYIAPVPPFHLFHLLPQPLRWLLGHRAHALCAARRSLAEPGRVIMLEGEFPSGRRYLAADGYHPSDLAYSIWAKEVADNIVNRNLKPVIKVGSQP